MKTIEGKIVVLGAQGVGKTSMVVRYVGKMFSTHISPTIGASFFTCKVNVGDTRVKLQVWDTAGQERFRSMAPMYYRNANAALLVYDITNEDSFKAIKAWVKELQSNVRETMVLSVVGNKLDLAGVRKVAAADGTQYAHSIGAQYYESSALQDTGIEQVFLNTATGLMKLAGESISTSIKTYDDLETFSDTLTPSDGGAALVARAKQTESLQQTQRSAAAAPPASTNTQMSECPPDPPSPAVSDEKMDTGSESFPSSQHTPNTPSEPDDLPSSSNDVRNYTSDINIDVTANTAVLRLANPPEYDEESSDLTKSPSYYDESDYAYSKDDYPYLNDNQKTNIVDDLYLKDVKTSNDVYSSNKDCLFDDVNSSNDDDLKANIVSGLYRTPNDVYSNKEHSFDDVNSANKRQFDNVNSLNDGNELLLESNNSNDVVYSNIKCNVNEQFDSNDEFNVSNDSLYSRNDENSANEFLNSNENVTSNNMVSNDVDNLNSRSNAMSSNGAMNSQCVFSTELSNNSADRCQSDDSSKLSNVVKSRDNKSSNISECAILLNNEATCVEESNGCQSNDSIVESYDSSSINVMNDVPAMNVDRIVNINVDETEKLSNQSDLNNKAVECNTSISNDEKSVNTSRQIEIENQTHSMNITCQKDSEDSKQAMNLACQIDTTSSQEVSADSGRVMNLPCQIDAASCEVDLKDETHAMNTPCQTDAVSCKMISEQAMTLPCQIDTESCQMDTNDQTQTVNTATQIDASSCQAVSEQAMKLPCQTDVAPCQAVSEQAMNLPCQINSEEARSGSNPPPRLTSTLTLTDDHPLMGLSSPESPPSMGNYPDLILQSRKTNRNVITNDSTNFLTSECSGMLSLSSTEDESFNRSMINGDLSSLYSDGFSNQDGPMRNTSKNNLYFSDNFSTSDGNRSVEGNEDHRHFTTVVDGKLSVTMNVVGYSNKGSVQPDILMLDNTKRSDVGVNTERSLERRPDVAERKKVKADVRAPRVKTDKKANTMQERVDNASTRVASLVVTATSTPEKVITLDGQSMDTTACMSFVSQVSDFPKSPSELRSCLNYELPIEMPSNFPATDEATSADSSCSSPLDENERSLYQAELDPLGGRVSLRPRRRIRPLPNDTDTDSVAMVEGVELRGELSGSASSLDSMSGCSLHSGENRELSQTETDTDNGRSADNSQESNGKPEKIPEYSLSEERRDSRLWLKVTLPSGERRTIDMKVIEPYKRVLSHGGYAQAGRRDAIVVFSACFLPDSSRVDYNYVMDNLFLYVLTTLEQLVTDDYIMVYLHGSAAKRSMPTFHWLKKCYQLVDRRLRKSLKHLYLVHPTFWLKSIMWMTRPFISSKFSRKLSYVHSLDELMSQVPVEPAAIPERVRTFDSERA